MPSYASSAELTAEIRKRAKLFAAEFEGIPEGSWDDVPEGADRSPRQMIAYQLGWMDLLLGWERDEQAGLFGEQRRAWASSTPSAWPVWKWIHINTVAPFTTFRAKVRKWKRAAGVG